MLKLAAVMWIILGAVIAGSFVVVIVAVPSLANEAMRYIPMAAVAGYVVAIPLAFVLAKKLAANSAARG